MSKPTIELPDSLHRRAELIAGLDGLSFEHFVVLAVAEKLSAIESVELLRREFAGANRADFERYLAAVPDNEPIATDHLTD